MLASHRWAYTIVEEEARAGHEAFAEHWVARHARERSARTLRWYRSRQAEIDEVAAAALAVWAPGTAPSVAVAQSQVQHQGHERHHDGGGHR